MTTCEVDGKKYILVHNSEAGPGTGQTDYPLCRGCVGEDLPGHTNKDLCADLGDCGTRTVWKEAP